MSPFSCGDKPITAKELALEAVVTSFEMIVNSDGHDPEMPSGADGDKSLIGIVPWSIDEMQKQAEDFVDTVGSGNDCSLEVELHIQKEALKLIREYYNACK